MNRSSILFLFFACLVFFSCKKEIDNQSKNDAVYTSQKNKAGLTATTNLSTIVVGTYNVRTDISADAPNNKWSDRKSMIADMITTYKFDVFGVQEAKDNQMSDLRSLLTGYNSLGSGRNSDGTGEHAAIFYNKNKYTVLASGNFWLSETPNVSGSIGWDATYPRVCTWAKIKEKTTDEFFYFFNTHLDLKKLAQTESIQLILSKIDQIAGTNPVVLTADFNFDQYSVRYTALNNSGKFTDAYLLNNYPYNPKGHTYNDFDVNYVSDKRVDHVFVSPHFQVDQFGILVDTYNNKLPSDHYPVRVLLNPSSSLDQPSSVSIPVGQVINIKGSNNKYVSSNNGTTYMKCDRVTTGSWENFQVINAGSGSIYLKAMNMYVSSEFGKTPMSCNRATAGSWERFDWIPNADGSFSLRGSNGRYVSSGNGTYDMTCESVEVQSWEKFRY